MAILLMAATELEIAPFYSLVDDEVDLLVHGIGSGIAAYHTTKALYKKKYNLVIQTGIAGSYEKGPSIGTSVVVQSDIFADLAIEENGEMKSLLQAGFSTFDEHPFEKGVLKNPWIDKLKDHHYLFVHAATVNLIHDDLVRTQKMTELYDLEIETMEGAAFHHVCLMEKIPFFQIRGISNLVGVRDKTKWKINEAISSTIPIIQDILHKSKAGILWK